MGLKDSGLRGSLRNVGSVLPAFFDVTITNTNSPVSVGDILTVDYSANNTGDVQDTQDIRLEIDSVQEDVDTNVTLSGNTSTTGTLQWDTTNESTADYTATVLSNDDSDTVTVTVESAIPDSADLHHRYDWREASGTSSVTDQTGNGYDLSGTYSGPNASINGNEAGDFDGTDDLLDVTFGSQISQPYHIFAVFQLPSVPSSNAFLYDDVDGLAGAFSYRSASDEFRAYAGDTNLSGGAADTNPHILSVLYNGSNSVMRIDGSQVASGDAGTRPRDGETVGAKNNSTDHGNFHVGELLFYPQDKSSIQSDVESYLSNEWGITI